MDIKCNDTGCALKGTCARFTAEDKPRQKYYNVSPRWNNECNMFFSTVPESAKELAEQRGEEARELHRSFS